MGTGSVTRLDPGTGPDRYQRAHDLLVETDAQVAFASFTFDPTLEGSVVLIPDSVEEHGSVPLGGAVPSGRVLSDGKSTWQNGIDRALAALESGDLDKVVLTRKVTVGFDHDLDATTVASRLIDQQKGCYVFSIDGLIGASPELLASLDEGVITSLVLAGTGVTDESLESAKMTREHVLAANSVRDGISNHVAVLDSPARTILEFGDIKHLATRFSGPARNGASVLDLLATLHPTASVAGTPTEKALDLIREIEPASRGRYAGPVGWFNRDGEGEFALALRCGLFESDHVTLFAGGGLVDGSDTVGEFAETELKLRPMLQALGLE